MGQRLMTVNEAMAALGVAHQNTVYSMIRRGDIRGFKIRGFYRVEAKSIEDYLRGLGTPEDYLTVDDVAEELSVVRITVYRLIRENGLPARKIRKEWRIPKDEYEAWKESLAA